MRQAWLHLLKKKLPPHYLAGVNVAVFGLGDSSYPKFNFAAKKLHKRLLNLGATALVARGDGDDQHVSGYCGALDPFLRDLWAQLAVDFPSKERPVRDSELLPPRYIVNFLDDDDDDDDDDDNADMLLDSSAATVASNTRLTSTESEQLVCDVALAVPNLPAAVRPGDVCHVYPTNADDEIDRILDRLQLRDMADRRVRIDVRDQRRGTPPFFDAFVGVPVQNGQVTVRQLFRHFLDVRGSSANARRFYQVLAAHTNSDDKAQCDRERERLLYFASADGHESAYAYAERERRTFFEHLEQFRTVAHVPLEYVLDLLPPLRARAFSISSHAPARGVSLTVGEVRERTPSARQFVGLCSSQLAHAAVGAHFNVFIESAPFAPVDVRAPLVLVAPGTGCAVARLFVEERVRAREAGRTDVGDTYFFFGCRHQQHEQLHADFFRAALHSGALAIYECAYSRDQPKKVYVQHKMHQRAELLRHLLLERADTVLVVAGSAKKMAGDVRDAFVSILYDDGRQQQQHFAAKSDAERFVRRLEVTGRYIAETW